MHEPARHGVDLPAVSCTSVDALLAGPVRAAEVLGSFPAALYLAVGDTVLAVLPAPSARLPFGVWVPSVERLPAVGPADPVLVGGGRVEVEGRYAVTPRRRHDPPAPRRWPGPAAPGAAQMCAASAARAAADLPAAAVAEVAALAASTSERLAAGAVGAAVRAVVGAGRGLTPAGDDALVGLLLVLEATGGTPAPLADAVGAAAARTTRLSAALLRAAASGTGSALAVDLVDALRAGGCALRAALRAVVATGATSGADTVVGVAAGLRARALAAAA